MHPPMAQAAHRPHAHCAVSWCALSRIVASSPAVSRLCLIVSLRARERLSAVSQRLGLPCRALCRDTKPCRSPPPPSHDTKFVSQHKPLPRARCRVYRSPQRRIVAHYCAISQPVALCVAKPGLSSYHDTKNCIVTHSASKAVRAHAALRPCARQAVSWPLLAVSQGAWAPWRRVPNYSMS